MANRSRALLLALTVLVVLTACQSGTPVTEGSANAVLTVTAANNGQSVTLAQGQSLQIVLDENATTGYTWAVDSYSTDILAEQGSKADYPSAGVMGAGGQVTFTFTGKAPGDGSIHLKNWREWEGDSSITARFDLMVKVTP